MNKENKRKQRACIVRQKQYPWQRNMRRNAETLFKEGYEVDVICVGFKGQKKFEVMAGVNIHRVYYSHHRGKLFWYLLDYSVFFFLVSLKLACLSLRKRFDVIEVCNVPDFLVFATLFPKLLGSKVIFFMFEKTEALFTTSFKLSKKHIFTRMVRFITKLSAIYANSVIATDVIVQKQLVEDYGIPLAEIARQVGVSTSAVSKMLKKGQ